MKLQILSTQIFILVIYYIQTVFREVNADEVIKLTDVRWLLNPKRDKIKEMKRIRNVKSTKTINYITHAHHVALNRLATFYFLLVGFIKRPRYNYGTSEMFNSATNISSWLIHSRGPRDLLREFDIIISTCNLKNMICSRRCLLKCENILNSTL